MINEQLVIFILAACAFSFAIRIIIINIRLNRLRTRVDILEEKLWLLWSRALKEGNK